jgi:hypothetical protein
MKGQGDRLARGGVRANFQTTDGKISQSKWDQAFENLDIEAFENAPNKSRLRSEPEEQEEMPENDMAPLNPSALAALQETKE